MKYNILVTGCGGDIGQSIGKILKSNPEVFYSVIGADLHNEHAGKFIFDKTVIMSSCRSENYLADLEQLVVKEQIDAIIPISEPELRFFTEYNVGDTLFGKPLIKADSNSLNTGFDKLKTANFLRDHNLPFPESTILKDLTDPRFPFILKSRHGSGSKSLFVINDSIDLEYFRLKFHDFLAQEIVGSEDEEYTCGLFRSKYGEIRQIIYKRKLVGGFSGYGSVERVQEIEELLFSIAEGLQLRGSINVQLRISDRGPCVFEINPRFSSTVMFRHLMGFEDVIWSLTDALSLPLPTFKINTNFTKFYKGYQEYVD